MKRTIAVALAVLSCACGAKPESQAEPNVAEVAAPSQVAAPPEQPEAPPSDRVEDPTFELMAKPAGPYKPGELGSFAVSLTPRGEYHINQDFPMTVSVEPSAALDFPKAKLGKPEAAEYGENLARFDVPFTAKTAGSHTTLAKVRFAVCTPENCVPDERTLAVVLPVE
jgi:hypothetical protein